MLMGKSEETSLLPVSWTMRAALGVTAFATLFIGIMPDRFINIVNWSLVIVQSPAGRSSSTKLRELRILDEQPCRCPEYTSHPDPTPRPEDSFSRGKENFWVQAGRYSQLAFILPAAFVVGWLIGAALDRWYTSIPFNCPAPPGDRRGFHRIDPHRAARHEVIAALHRV